MAEHWKSTPKYWCKHCQIYVKDVPFERKNHEATGKHQANLKRFLNTIQKDHARNEREKDKAKAEVERLNRVVGRVDSNIGPGPSTAATPAYTKSSTTLSASDRQRQWAQLAEMGITVPPSARANAAQAGDWQTTSRHLVSEPEAEEDKSEDDQLAVGIRKRKYEGDEEEREVGGEVARRGWGTALRHYPGQVTDDIDSLLEAPSLKLKTETPTDPEINLSDPQQLELNEESEKFAIKKDVGSSASEHSPSTSMSKDETLQSLVAGDDSNLPSQQPGPIFKKRKAKSFKVS